MSTTNCLNCGHSISASGRFCSQCGQKASTHRFKWHDLWHDAIHYFTHADKGIFHLLRELALRPGVVAREFVQGRRSAYFKPLNFFLIVAGILVFMSTRFHKENDSRAQQIERGAAYAKSPQQKAYFMAMAERSRKASGFISKYSNLVNMMATPLITFFLWLFYLRGKYNYIEHLVANMFIMPFIMLFYALIILPLQYFSTGSSITYGLLITFFVIELIYRSIAYYRFINKKGTWHFLKAFGAILFTILLWAFGTYYLISTYIRTGFE